MSGPNINEYNANIPVPEDVLSDSQYNFKVNFQQLFNAFSKNHVPLNDTVLTPGNHTKIELVKQQKGPETRVGELSLYSKKVAQQTNQLFVKFQAGNEIQLTAYQLYPAQQLQWQKESYFTFLPGNIIVYFGTVIPNLSPDGNKVNFPPYVMKNVMCCAFCARNATPVHSPTITLNKDGSGNISSATLYQLIPNYSYFYLMIGNM